MLTDFCAEKAVMLRSRGAILSACCRTPLQIAPYMRADLTAPMASNEAQRVVTLEEYVRAV
jgi:hypothetical protein